MVMSYLKRIVLNSCLLGTVLSVAAPAVAASAVAVTPSAQLSTEKVFRSAYGSTMPFSLTWDGIAIQKEQLAQELKTASYIRTGVKTAAVVLAAYMAYRYLYAGKIPGVNDRLATLEHQVGLIRGKLGSDLGNVLAPLETPKASSWFAWTKGFALDIAYQGATLLVGKSVFGTVESALKNVFHDGSIGWLVSSRIHLNESIAQLQEYIQFSDAGDSLMREKRTYARKCMQQAGTKLFEDMATLLGFMQCKKEGLSSEEQAQVDAIIDYLFVISNDFGVQLAATIDYQFGTSAPKVMPINDKSAVLTLESIKKFQLDIARAVTSFMRI